MVATGKHKHPLSGRAGTYVGLGTEPDDAGTIVRESEVSKPEILFYWVGLEVVQKRNIRVRENPDTEEKELVFNLNSSRWDSPIYCVLQKTVTMPRLGETIHLDQWTADRLFEQMPPNSLLTAGDGGKLIADYLLEQIANNVPLPELTRGSFKLDRSHQEEQVTLDDLLENTNEDEIRQALMKRGVAHILASPEEEHEFETETDTED